MTTALELSRSNDGASLAGRVADAALLEAALEAGLLLSAGGSGRASVARHRQIGEAALSAGVVRFAAVSELKDEDQIIVATGVGAPGQARKNVGPHDCVEAARLLIKGSGMTPAGVIPGHVPGLYAWLQAATLGLPVVDAAANGRGHPTVKMGGMGYAARRDLMITQAGSGGRVEDGSLVRVVAEGNIAVTSSIMRHAAVQNGGLIMAARGPLTAAWVREHGAIGAIAFQLQLGERMLDAGSKGERRIQAMVDGTRGTLAGTGTVSAKTVAYSHGFETGEIRVGTGRGELTLGVCNEHMTLVHDGKRVATFPDLIATVDPHTGDPLAISELEAGSDVAVIVASKRNFPVGAGVRDPNVYPEIEERMGVELARYALDPDV